jgi:hypothetical protein
MHRHTTERNECTNEWKCHREMNTYTQASMASSPHHSISLCNSHTLRFHFIAINIDITIVLNTATHYLLIALQPLH